MLWYKLTNIHQNWKGNFENRNTASFKVKHLFGERLLNLQHVDQDLKFKGKLFDQGHSANLPP